MQGLWLGIIAALLTQAVLLTILILYTDWNKEVCRDPTYSVFLSHSILGSCNLHNVIVRMLKRDLHHVYEDFSRNSVSLWMISLN